MVQAVSIGSGAAIGAAFSSRSAGATPTEATPARYGGDAWRSPAPRTIAAPPPAAPAPANDTDLTARARETAALSADVYNDVASPPPGYRVATQRDLDRLHLTPHMLEQPGASSFRARVYVTGSGADTRYVVSFRGTQNGEDWLNNLQQGAGLSSESYSRALQIGRQLARSDANVTLTGHSLGGGLASAAAIACGREADTYNAAGLSQRTIVEARGIAGANGRGTAAVQAYHVPGEALTMIQNGGDRAIGSGIGSLFGGAGGLIGGLVVDAPEAYGRAHTLPDVRPSDRSFLDGLNPIDRHGMDWVLAGVGALR